MSTAERKIHSSILQLTEQMVNDDVAPIKGSKSIPAVRTYLWSRFVTKTETDITMITVLALIENG